MMIEEVLEFIYLVEFNNILFIFIGVVLIIFDFVYE